MSDPAYLILGKILFGLAVAVGLLALFLDPARQLFLKRRRCPRCWYDMSGSPGLTCIECGYTAKRERKLRKGRRYWRFLLLVAMLLPGSHLLKVTPDVKQRGWVAAMPTTGLILCLPSLEPTASRNDKPALRRSNDPSDRLLMELIDHRIDNDSLWSMQERLLVERCFAGDRSRELAPFPWTPRSARLLARSDPWTSHTARAGHKLSNAGLPVILDSMCTLRRHTHHGSTWLRAGSRC